MPLPQDIAPINGDLVDFLARGSDNDWVPQPDDPARAFMRVLWTGGESGQSALIFRWLKGYKALPHKHLGASHTYIIKGKLQVRDGTLEAGDYVYEPDGVIHHMTEALEDTDYLFIVSGALLFFGEDGFTGYFNWETARQWKAAHFEAQS